MAEGGHDQRGQNVNPSSEGTVKAIGVQNLGTYNATYHNSLILIGSKPEELPERGSAPINIVNAATRQKTSDKILDDFKTERLQQPSFQVNPQMRKVRVEEYFKGDYEDVEGMESTITKSSWFGRQTKKVLKNQLRKEKGFHSRQGRSKDALTFNQVLRSINGENDSSDHDKTSVIGIVASAGSGKTTLMRRLARKSLDTILQTQEGSHQVASKMIYFIELKTIQYADSVTPSSFLFGGLFENEADEQKAYRWLLDNQTKAVLYFDGLDQATWKIDNTTKYNKLNPFSHADAATIMYNILSGNLLPHAKIVLASREFKVSELPAEARPTDIITLSGFTPEDAQKLFVFLIGKDGAKAWKNIRTISPRILNFLSVPVFLILTAVVMARDPTNPPPTTVTALYKRILVALRGVENIRQRDEIDEIIGKLKSMAYQGMEEGRVVFYEEDLRNFGVSIEEVQDLIMKVPGNNLLSRHLVEGDFIFFFCHQSIQEFLAATFIAQMAFRKFSQFEVTELHEKRWSVVRRFVFGLVFGESEDDLFKISDQTKKKQVLTRWISSQLDEKTKETGKYTRLELYSAICESVNENFAKQISVIDTSHTSLSREDAHIVGWLAARKKRLDSLNLEDCMIDDELLGIIAACLKDRIHVKNVDLSANYLSAKALRSLLGHHRIEALSGNLDWKVVWLTAERFTYELTNEKHAIKINGIVEGSFNIEESTLSFKTNTSLASVVVCCRLFDAQFIKLNVYKEVLVTQDDLREISKRKVEGMRKILLDCTKERNIDWSLIENSLEESKIEFISIAVDVQAYAHDLKMVLERARGISDLGCHIDIRAMFFVKGRYSFKKIVEACQQHKMEYIRCILEHQAHASLDDILSLVEDLNCENVALIYSRRDDGLRSEDLHTALRRARELGSRFYFESLQRRSEDAWKVLDRAFYNSH